MLIVTLRLVRPVLSVLVTTILSAVAVAETRTVPQSYPTIQAAIDASADGDVVLVDPGTYLESIDFLSKAIVVESVGGADVTMIDAGGSGPVVSIANVEGPGATLRGFTITGGSSSSGGGVRVIEASPLIESNRIVFNNATSFGGGISIEDPGPAIAVIRANVINDNTVTTTAGGIGVSDASVIVEDNEIARNVANGTTGGVFVGGAATLKIERNRIVDNVSSRHGAGIHLSHCGDGDPADILIKRNRIEANRVTGAHSGGGIYLGWVSARVINNEILSNRGYDAGGIKLRSALCELKKNRIGYNRATDEGGGISAYLSELISQNNQIYRNSAVARGGGVHLSWSTASLINDTVFDNGSGTAGGTGGGVFGDLQSSATLTNVIVRANRAGSLPQLAVQATVTFSNIEGGLAGQGNIDDDPLFVDSLGADPDFHLRLGSPCIDAGNAAASGVPAVDMDGHPRGIDGDLDTVAGIDMGADEVDPSHAALFGGVNVTAGHLVRVLFVNGDSGGDARVVRVDAEGPIVLTMERPTAGGPGRFFVHANVGLPNVATVTPLPLGLGWSAFPVLLSDGADPVAVFNNIGKETLVGSSTYFDGTPIADPPVANTDFLVLPAGDPANLPVGTIMTLQGAIIDPASGSSKPASITNGVIMVVE